LGQWGLILFIEHRSNALATQAAPFLKMRAGNTSLAAVLGYKNNTECELALWNVSSSIHCHKSSLYLTENSSSPLYTQNNTV
jgi:hypothetical protein